MGISVFTKGVVDIKLVIRWDRERNVLPERLRTPTLEVGAGAATSATKGCEAQHSVCASYSVTERVPYTEAWSRPTGNPGTRVPRQ